MYRILAPAALIGMLAAAAPAGAAPSPAAVGLRPGDLPPGFVLSFEHDMTIAGVARHDGRSAAHKAGAGFLLGHDADFTRRAGTGLREIATQIEVYTSAATLRGTFVADLKAAAGVLATYHAVAVRGLGTEGRAYRTTAATARGASTEYLFIFRRGVYLAYVFVFGDARTTLARTLAYPKLVDARIEAASR